MEYVRVTAPEFSEMGGLDDWRFALGAIRAEFATGSFPGAAELISLVSAAAEEHVHHPDLMVRYPGTVRVTLTTHATGGLTMLDVDLAREVSRLAASVGAESQPLAAQAIELAIDTMDADVIRPFWTAVLDYRVADDGSIFDPRRDGPAIWFQQMDRPRTERNRFHLDISVPHDVAEQRIAATIATGGTLVSDAAARAFWILADADGNEACICTWQDR